MSLAIGIGPSIANHLWQSTAFAAVCGLLTLALRRNPARVRHSLWLAASLKFLVPFSILVNIGGLFPTPRPASLASPAVMSSAIDAASPFGNPVPAEASSALVQPLPHVPSLLPRLLLLPWLAGFCSVIIVWCRRWRHVSVTVRDAAIGMAGQEAEILRRLESYAKPARPIPILRTPSMMEPGIFGAFRPVLLWPKGLSEQLTGEQIESILAHELAHVRRHDNLAALLHMLVEAVFWFHPLVWWIESRIVEEREHACDEAAVLQVGSADTYAESLLKACRFCLESPLPCVPGIAGGNLRRRVLRITSSRLLQNLDIKRKAMLCLAGFVSLAVPVLMGAAHAPQNGPAGSAPTENQAQQGPADPDAVAEKFDVVSIRPSRPDENGGGTRDLPDGIRWMNMPLSMLVKGAYDVEFEKQLIGFPPGFDSQHYDIEARMNEQAAAKWRALPLKKRGRALEPMLRSILADRCQFKAHYEDREQPIYELVIAKGGLKMSKSNEKEGSTYQVLDRSHDIGTGVPGNNIVHQIPVYDRVIVDKTGLGDEKYDFDLQWSQGDEQPGDPAESRPTIFKALEEQLGLKLVPAKGPVKSLVIDHIERPSPN